MFLCFSRIRGSSVLQTKHTVKVGKGGANCSASCFRYRMAPRKPIYSSTIFHMVKGTLLYSSPRACLPLDSRHKFAIYQRQKKRTEAADPISRDQILRHKCGQETSLSLSSSPPAGSANIPTYPVDAQAAVSDDTHRHTYIQESVTGTYSKQSVLPT